jgi:hypothetical protein
MFFFILNRLLKDGINMKFVLLFIPAAAAFLPPILQLEAKLISLCNFTTDQKNVDIQKLCASLPNLTNLPVDEEDVQSILTSSSWDVLYTRERKIQGVTRETACFKDLVLTNSHFALEEGRRFELVAPVKQSGTHIVIKEPIEATLHVDHFSSMRIVPWLKPDMLYQIIYLSNTLMIQKRLNNHGKLAYIVYKKARNCI